MNFSAGFKNHLEAQNLSHKAKQIVDLVAQHKKPLLYIAASATELNEIEDNIRFFADQATPVLRFSDWETLPYDSFSPHQDIISDRLNTLAQIRDLSAGIVLTTTSSALTRICPEEHIDAQRFEIVLEQKIDQKQLVDRLTNGGYLNVETVNTHGEFAVRGAIMDVFPMGVEHPIRVEWFDDEIESIRWFDVDSQRTIEKVTEIKILPAREIATTQHGITGFRKRFRERFDIDPLSSPIYQDVSEGIIPGGIEYYLPLFFDQTGTLFDYLSKDTLIARNEQINEYVGATLLDYKTRYESLAYDIQKPILKPSELCLIEDEFFAKLNQHPGVIFGQISDSESLLPNLATDPQNRSSFDKLSHFIEQQNSTLIVAESAGRREALLDLLHDASIRPKVCEDWQDFLTKNDGVFITDGLLSKGFLLDEHNALVAESDLLGERVTQPRRRKASNIDEDAIIRNLTELRMGAPVVHIDHGVGRYLGLTNLSIDGQETELLTLGYANDAKLYVPVSSLQLISRYTGADEEHAPLHKLGTEKWSAAKQKAAEKARDTAAELLDIYAKRESKKGHAFASPDEAYKQFSAGFPFEETPDQQLAIDAVIRDMSSAKAMDRLVCGDVGFGKTEVAMRAAFLAVQDGKQVAVLVPTTLLAQQHYDNFCDRFADWPVQVELLSRFRSGKQTNAAIERIQEGKADIVVGTHKLIQGDINFANLGLVIIDEEHRFGVKQKDQFKALRAEVDILTLTATPIPRTLNMSLSGIRDLSIIATPPAKRLSVKTFVKQKDDHQIREAVLRELYRGGQVYYLHNEVQSIEKAAEDLKALVPEARVIVGHGQMRERELEQVMSDFYHKRANVLVCSTIIETGIDVPNANTILIDRADKFGLAQLHQLRGRVGRSHHQAYAYLLTPNDRKITPDAEKRLEAISMADTL